MGYVLTILQVCVITGLFEYLTIFPEVFIETDGKLFPGVDTQEQRFGELLHKILLEHEEEVNMMGYEVDDIGIHSVRKGGTTYACSGTTVAPSTVAVNIRGGWSLGGYETFICCTKEPVINIWVVYCLVLM